MLGRRHFLLSVSAAALGAGAACGKPSRENLSCMDLTGVDPDDVAARNAVTYMDRARDKTKTCETCVQFVAPKADGACASCKVLKGPIHPDGYCSAYAKKT
jgi:hypothetical protein